MTDTRNVGHRHTPVVVRGRNGEYQVCEKCGRLRPNSLTKFGRPRQWREAWGADDMAMVAAAMEVR